MLEFCLVTFFFIFVMIQDSDLVCTNSEQCVEDTSPWFVKVSQDPVCYKPSLQSPISLDYSSSIPVMGNTLPVFYNDFDSRVLLSLKKVGASARFLLRRDSSVKPTVSGGAFLIWPPYQFHDLHVHVRDSEHIVDGKRYPIEAHAVHWNTKYSSFEEAKKKTDGLLVMAFFGEEGDKDTLNLVGSLWSSLDLGESVTVTGDDLLQFFGNRVLSHQPYFYYRGSLTSAPYSENVQWIVFKNPFLLVSSDQLKTLTERESLNTLEKYNQSRELQCRNGRKVFYVCNIY